VGLITELNGRGYAVGAIKRSHHPLPLDKPGSDTDLFARAGASAVIFGASDGILVRGPEPAMRLADLVSRFAGTADVVVVEGFKHDVLGAVAEIEQPAGGGNPGRVALRSMDGRRLLRTRMDDIAGLADAFEAECCLSAAGDVWLRDRIRAAAVTHGHRCAGITLGVRMALAAAEALGLDLPAAPHRLNVTLETARCAADAVATATGCSVGKSDLRVHDVGKLAAVFTDLEASRAVRVSVRSAVRDLVSTWAPGVEDPRRAQDIAYRLIPDTGLFTITEAEPEVEPPAPRGRVDCAACGEEVVLRHAVPNDGRLWCQPCASRAPASTGGRDDRGERTASPVERG